MADQDPFDAGWAKIETGASVAAPVTAPTSLFERTRDAFGETNPRPDYNNLSAKEGNDALRMFDLKQQGIDDRKMALLDELERDAKPMSLGTREAAKWKIDQQGGVQKFLESKYPDAEGIAQLSPSNWAVFPKEGKPILMEGAGDAFAEAGKDVLDVLPEAMIGAAGVVGAAGGAAVGAPTAVGAIPAGIAGAGAATAAARGFQQGVSEVLSDDDMDLSERLIDLGGHFLLGAAGEAIGVIAQPLIARAAKRIVTAEFTPTARSLKEIVEAGTDTVRGQFDPMIGRASKGTVQESLEAGIALSERLKTPMNLNEIITNEASVRHAAVAARRDPAKAVERALKQSQGASKQYQIALDKISPKASVDEIANRAAAIKMDNIEELVKTRRVEAKAIAKAGSELTGIKPIADMEKAIEMADDLMLRTGSEEERTALKQLRELMANEGYNFDVILERLSKFSRAAGEHKGRGELTQWQTAQMFDSMLGSLDDVIAGKPQNIGIELPQEVAGKAAQLAKELRTTYATMSTEIKTARTNAFSKAVEKVLPKNVENAAAVADSISREGRLLSFMASKDITPETVERVMRAAHKTDHTMANMYQRGLVEELLSGARIDAGLEMAGGATINPARLAMQFYRGKNPMGPKIAKALYNKPLVLRVIRDIARLGHSMLKSPELAAKLAGKDPNSAGEIFANTIGRVMGGSAGMATGGGFPAATGGAAFGGSFLKKFWQWAFTSPKGLAAFLDDPKRTQNVWRLLGHLPEGSSPAALEGWARKAMLAVTAGKPTVRMGAQMGVQAANGLPGAEFSQPLEAPSPRAALQDYASSILSHGGL